MPNYDALILTLCINGFDVHRLLINHDSAADLVQLPSFKQMKLSLDTVNSTGFKVFSFNSPTLKRLDL